MTKFRFQKIWKNVKKLFLKNIEKLKKNDEKMGAQIFGIAPSPLRHTHVKSWKFWIFLPNLNFFQKKLNNLSKKFRKWQNFDFFYLNL